VAIRGHEEHRPDIGIEARVHAGHLELVLELRFETGTTIAEIVETVQPKPFLRRHCRVWVGGEPIQPEVWSAVRPKAGSRVEIIASIPQGGG
jgi:hypothetical protein